MRTHWKSTGIRPPPIIFGLLFFSSISAASHMPYFNSLLKNLTHCTFICFNRFCWISMSLCCIDVIRFLLSLLCNNFTFISRMLQPFFYIFINIPNQQLVLLSCKRNSHVTIFEIDCKILKKACFLLVFKFLVYISAYSRPFGRTAEETQKTFLL